MASSALASRTFHRYPLLSSSPSHPSREACTPCCLPDPVSRRRTAVQLLSAGFLTAVSPAAPSLAARRGRILVPPEDYVTAPDGLKYCGLVEGKGPTAEKGSTVQVHFDCMYRGITAVSSRESKLLAGNRSIAQVMWQTSPEYELLSMLLYEYDGCVRKELQKVESGSWLHPSHCRPGKAAAICLAWGLSV